jgi:predicted 3-demethylubiquinone-9 3-methyltransferase (glyoxalase superfamily)
MEHNKQKIVPHLWFDKEAREAADFYVSAFKNSKIMNTSQLHNTPSGTSELVTMELYNQEFKLISAGPYFKLNPAISFLISCRNKDEVDEIWVKLSDRGIVRMELGKYPFSEKYGWVEDRFGVNWQIMYVGVHEIAQRITPTLMFVGDVNGKCEEAINFYTSVFHNAKVGDILRYSKGMEPDREGAIQHAAFTLEGQGFAAMDSAYEHKFSFNEATSFMVNCDTQDEIDYYWSKLSAHPEAEQCGWLKDKYGVSWQIVPTILDTMISDKDSKKVSRVTEAFLKMKKFNIVELKAAYNQ